jgi:hypothetical protein
VDKSQRLIRLAVKVVDQGSEITTAIANASATCSALMRLIGPGNDIGIIFEPIVMRMLSRKSQETQLPGNQDATLQMHKFCQNLLTL